jgi:diguanylate cyclase (GGDEF)-like protein
VLLEPKRKRVHAIMRKEFLAVLACALAAALGASAAAAADASSLDGGVSALSVSLAAPLGQSPDGQLSTFELVPDAPKLSLPPLSVVAPPPADAAPGSAAPLPASSTPKPGTSAPSAKTRYPAPTSGTRSERAAGAPSREASSRTPGSGADRVGADGGESSARTTAASDPSTRHATTARSRHKRSLATRIVDRVPSEYRMALFALAAIAILFGLLSVHEARRSRRAREDALADSLTGLANRDGLERRLEAEWRRAKRYERDLGLVLLDLDGFKEINDSQGHIAGDRILREAAAAIDDRVRETDMACRYGGDEFVVLCPETGDRGLKALADGLEETLARQGIRASAGFTQREPSDSSSRDLLARADAAMYRRKRESSARAGSLATAEA